MLRTVVVCLVVVAGCSSGADEDAGGVDGVALVVTGTVVDFRTGDPIAGQGAVSTVGLSPAPTVVVSGADFTIEEVPANSVFHVAAAAPPDYRTTFAAAVTVTESDVEGVEATVVAEAYLAELATGFGITPSLAGLVLARAVDADGAPLAGIPAAAFQLAQEQPVIGPFFLDADLAPAPLLAETSASGWVVFFEVAPGLIAVTAANDSGYTMDMPASPAQQGAATIATIVVSDGALVLPTNVSFREDVVTIFDARGCAACHSGSGPGKDLANLTLDGGDNLIYRELMDDASAAGARVDREAPEASLLLTMPSAEDPADGHPTIVFASPGDLDYLTLLVWIREGAVVD